MPPHTLGVPTNGPPTNSKTPHTAAAHSTQQTADSRQQTADLTADHNDDAAETVAGRSFGFHAVGLVFLVLAGGGRYIGGS